MHDEVIANMRDRIKQLRRISGLAHDPRMIEMLDKMAAQIESDIAKLEADREAGNEARES